MRRALRGQIPGLHHMLSAVPLFMFAGKPRKGVCLFCGMPTSAALTARDVQLETESSEASYYFRCETCAVCEVCGLAAPEDQALFCSRCRRYVCTVFCKICMPFRSSLIIQYAGQGLPLLRLPFATSRVCARRRLVLRRLRSGVSYAYW